MAKLRGSTRQPHAIGNPALRDWRGGLVGAPGFPTDLP
jgi:hypothetical protein